MDYSKIKNVEVEGIDTKDAPDFSDAYIVYAEYVRTEDEINELNEDGAFVHEKVFEQLF